jgi:hypothetical protein
MRRAHLALDPLPALILNAAVLNKVRNDFYSFTCSKRNLMKENSQADYVIHSTVQRKKKEISRRNAFVFQWLSHFLAGCLSSWCTGREVLTVKAEPRWRGKAHIGMWGVCV